jgi:hypothetical protein
MERTVFAKRARAGLCVFVATTLVACATKPPPPPAPPPPAPVAAAPPPPAPPPPPPPPAAPPPIPVLPFDDALLAAANTLFGKAPLGPGEQRPLVIDPLIDGVSGMQSAATVLMGSRIATLVRDKHPQFALQPFTVESLKALPVVLVGTFTAINLKNEVLKERDAYRICLALADLKTGRILSKGVARAQVPGIDTTPTTFFQDSPAWARDKLIQGYVRTCQATKPGDPIDAVYGERIAAAALTHEAIELYHEHQFARAAVLFRQAASTPSGYHLRNLNGWYSASWKTGNQKEATAATQRMVDYMMGEKNLAFRFLFRPGTSNFVAARELSAPYPLWLREIARGAVAHRACLQIVGHTSRTGPEPANERLSLARAQFIGQQLTRQMPMLVDRLATLGVGSREPVVGSGTDDARDAPDRRVEFKVVECGKG